MLSERKPLLLHFTAPCPGTWDSVLENRQSRAADTQASARQPRSAPRPWHPPDPKNLARRGQIQCPQQTGAGTRGKLGRRGETETEKLKTAKGK